MNCFDEKYDLGPPRRTTCEINGEHHGDPHPIQDDADERAVWVWNCCGEEDDD